MDVISASEELLILIFGVIGLTLFGLVFGVLFKGVDRKISARVQGVVSPSFRQMLSDMRQLFSEENVVPKHAVGWVYNFAPVACLLAVLTILLYLPIGGFQPLISSGGDIVLVLYLLVIPMVALIIGGFASGASYASVIGHRQMGVMISYVFPFAIILVSIAWKLSQLGNEQVFSIGTITANPVWNISAGPLGFIGFGILLVALVIVTPAELCRFPSDADNKKTIGINDCLVEYSGRNLAMVYLADGVKTVVLASVVVALFFPYNLMSFIEVNQYVGWIIDILFYLVKVLLVVVCSVILYRLMVSRWKFDKTMYTNWVPLTLMSLIGLIFVMWDGVITRAIGL